VVHIPAIGCTLETKQISRLYEKVLVNIPGQRHKKALKTQNFCYKVLVSPKFENFANILAKSTDITLHFHGN
jgi:hypothetical protein